MKKINNYLKSVNEKSESYIPKEEQNNLKQVIILILMLFLALNTLFILVLSILGCNYNFNIINNSLDMTQNIIYKNLLHISIIDIITSLSVVYIIKKEKVKLLILVSLLPINSIIYVIYPDFIYSILSFILILIHTIASIFGLKILKDLFVRFSKINNLDYSIVVVFLMIVLCVGISFIFEKQSLADAIYHSISVFTSNGYGSIVETNPISKLSSNLLMILGYIMSTIGTAGLTTIFIKKLMNSDLKNELDKTKDDLAEMKEINEKINKDLEEIKELLKKKI